MKTCLVQLRIGDMVIYEPENRAIEVKIKDYQLTPNGMNDPKLVCVITAVRNDGFEATATSDKFSIKETEDYIDKYQKFETK